MSSSGRLRTFLGGHEVLTRDLWKAAAAEFTGTLLLVLLACGSCYHSASNNFLDLVSIALGFGFAIATVVQCICHVSGGHINPAVTVGMLVTGKVSLVRFFVYVLVQTTGAVAASAILYGLCGKVTVAVSMPSELSSMKLSVPYTVTKVPALGLTQVSDKLTPWQGLGVELLITFVLVLTVYAVCDANRQDVKGSPPLAIGLAIATCHLFAVPLTGAGMNPARAFGPALVHNGWKNHWVYWIGPIIGAILAALLYEFVFSAPAVNKTITEDLGPVEDLPLVTIKRAPGNEALT